MRTLGRIWGTFARGLRRFFVLLFGRWTWEAPGWLAWIGRQVARGWRAIVAHPVRAALAALILIGVGSGAAWYYTRPKPHYATFEVTEPGLTEYNANGIAAIKPLTIVFSESVAPLK